MINFFNLEMSAPRAADLEGTDPASQRGGAPRAADLEGADPASQGGCPRAADLEGADPASQRWFGTGLDPLAVGKKIADFFFSLGRCNGAGQK